MSIRKLQRKASDGSQHTEIPQHLAKFWRYLNIFNFLQLLCISQTFPSDLCETVSFFLCRFDESQHAQLSETLVEQGQSHSLIDSRTWTVCLSFRTRINFVAVIFPLPFTVHDRRTEGFPKILHIHDIACLTPELPQ